MSKKDAIDEKKKINFFEMFEAGDASELSEVLNNFYSAEKNLELKTEVHKPRSVSILDVLIAYLEESGYHEPARYWKVFRESYLKLMISYNRGGRIEMVEILKELKDELKDNEAYSE